VSTATSTMSAVVPARAMWSRTDGCSRSLSMCAEGRRAGTAVEARAAMCFTRHAPDLHLLKACCLGWFCFNC
jgi:hypothetical protein